MSNVNYEIRKSVAVNFVGRYSNIVIQIAVTAVLARMLNPADFGVVAAVAVLVTFVSFISEMGLGPAVVQFQDLKASQVAGLFWFTILLGTVVAILFAACGPSIARFYGDPEYMPIALALGPTIALSCWVIVPLAMLRKAKQFKAIVSVEVTSAVLSGILAVIAAFHHAGVFALILKSTAFSVLMFGLCVARCRFNPFIRPSFAGMRQLYSYSGYQFLFNLINYFTRNLDKIFIGRIMGAATLGIYDMSYRLMLMPIYNLTHVIGPALQPIYAAQQQDMRSIFASYQKVIRLLVIVGGFVGVVSFLCSRDIIFLFYGSKWTAAVDVFAILSLSISVQVVLSSSGAIFQSIGRTDLLSLSGTLSTLTSIPAIVIGAWSGNLKLLSWLLVASFMANTAVTFFVLARLGFKRTVYELFQPSAGCIAGVLLLLAASAVLKINHTLGEATSLWLLGVKVLAMAGSYWLLISFTGDLDFLRKAVAPRLSKRTPRNSRFTVGL